MKRAAEYLRNRVKNVSRGASYSLAELICAQFPGSFIDQIGGSVYGNGYTSFGMSIYNHLNYKKPDSEKKKRKRADDDSDNEDNMRRRKEQKRIREEDEYGCVEYAPDLQEDAALQEEKRIELKNLSNESNFDENVVETLIKQTYPTQRSVINHIDRNLTQIMTDWPILKCPKFLMSHASRLIGKSVKEEWNLNLQKKATSIRRFLRNRKIGTNEKEELKSIVRTCDDATIVCRSEVPKTMVIFPLLIQYFKEVEKHLFIVEDVKNTFFIFLRMYTSET